MIHFPDLSCMVINLPIALWSGIGLAGMLAFLFLFFLACFHFLTFYPGLFCNVSFFRDLFVNLFIIFGSSSSSLFFFRSRLRSQQSMIFFLALFTWRFCCVCYYLVEISHYGDQFSIFVYHCSKRCRSATNCCSESTYNPGNRKT